MKFTANRNNNFNSSGENDNDNSNDDNKNHSIASGRYGGSLSALHGGVSMAMRMPELLEGKPPLAMFDAIHIRISNKNNNNNNNNKNFSNNANNSGAEIGGLILALDNEYVIFLISAEAFQLIDNNISNVLIHARFIAAETALRQMYTAMNRIVNNNEKTETGIITNPIHIIPNNCIEKVVLNNKNSTVLINEEEEINSLDVYNNSNNFNRCFEKSLHDERIKEELEINEEQWFAAQNFARGRLPQMLNNDREYTIDSRNNNDDPNGVFVVLGPPGTGKTRTVIASIEYVAKIKPRHLMSISDDNNNTNGNKSGYTDRILACTPTDFAADIIADGLMKRNVPNVLRVNDPRR